MELRYVLELKQMEHDLGQLNELQIKQLNEEIKGIEGCGLAVTANTPIKTLIKIYKEEKDKLRKHSENDANKQGMTTPQEKQEHFKKCLDGISAVIRQYLSKTKKEQNMATA